MEILKRKLDTLDAHLLNAGGLLYMTYEIHTVKAFNYLSKLESRM